MANYKINGSVEKDFTKVPKTIIQDKSLSCEARIILEFLIDLIGEFSVNEHGLSTILGITEYKVKRAVIELENAGYIHRRRQRILNGSKFGGWFWDISVTPIFRLDIPRVENQLVENQTSEIQLVENQFEIQPVENQLSENQPVENQSYIQDRKDIRPIDTRLKEEETEREKTEEREFTPTLTPLNQSGESVISQQELNITQAFNRFCEVYPKVGNRDQARAAFFAIPDIDKICNQITNSVEWFEKTGRWNDWKTGQKNVSCPLAYKFLTRGDWQEYLKSGTAMSEEERLMTILNKSRQNVSLGGTDYAAN